MSRTEISEQWKVKTAPSFFPSFLPLFPSPPLPSFFLSLSPSLTLIHLVFLILHSVLERVQSPGDKVDNKRYSHSMLHMEFPA